jgi:phosphoribosylformimino-5-aminoimidazole carboxamide ribotide isomerase
MRILPVLDVMDGEVVRGVAGRRGEYRPIRSSLTHTSEPVTVARAFRDHFGLTTLYLADLDAILGGEPAWELYHALRTEGFDLWVDAGVTTAPRAEAVAGTGVDGVVLGLETIAGPEVLAAACEMLGGWVIFSLDLRGGEPLGQLQGWRHRDPWSIACGAVACGVRRLLVLDLASVGMGAGLGTELLCARLAAAYPVVELYAGGGVRGLQDLQSLRECGIRAALVASALHDGRLTRAEICALRAP